MPQVTYTTNLDATNTLDITVKAVNTDTVADVQEINEDEIATGNVLTNDEADNTEIKSFTVDIDGDGNAESFTFGQTATIAGVGQFVLNKDGSYSFTPDANWNGVMPQVTYTTNLDATNTLDITVKAVNTDTVADVQEINEDEIATGNVLTNDEADNTEIKSFTVDIDGDGNAESFTFGQTATIAGVGQFVLNKDGSYSFTPDANWNGVMPQVTYTTNLDATNTLDITVKTVNTDTVADVQEINEGEIATGNVLTNDEADNTEIKSFTVDIDGDGNAESFTFGQTATIAGVGQFVLNKDGSYSFTPDANWNGVMPQVTYTTNLDATNTLDITVKAVNTDTVADVQEINEDEIATGNVLTNDEADNTEIKSFTVDIDGDGNAESFTFGQTATIAGVGQFVLNKDGSYSFTPDANWNGVMPQVTYTTNLDATNTLDITVKAVNTDTVADVQEINEDEIATGNVLTNDEADNTEIKSFTVDIDGDGNAESFTFGQTATIAGVGQFVLNKDGSYSFTPDANWNGVMPQVTYTTNLDATNTLDITVKAVNTDTVADVQEINEDEIATGNVLTNDEADNTEIKSFTVDIDGDGNAESFTFGQTATIAGVGQFVLNKDGSYSFTPDANWNGVMPQVTYTTNLDATNTLDITVKAVNTDTVADVQEINEDEIATGNVLTNDEADNTEIKSFTVDIDGDGNAESFTFGQTATIAGVGQFVLNKDGSYSFTPDANWNGVMPQVTYTTNLDATNTLDITVKAVNTDTVADVQEINEDEIATGNVLTNDEADNTEIKSFTVDIDGDGNAESFTFGQTATIAGVGQFVLNKDGSYSFTPDANWNGVMPQVTYTTNLDATNTLDITVKAVNTDTVADVQEINEDEIATGNVLTNDEADNTEIKSFTVDIDGDGNAESFTFGQTATIAGVGQFVLNKDGSYSFTPDANWNGVMPQVTYTNLDATNEFRCDKYLRHHSQSDGDGNAESFTFGQTATIAGVGQFVLNNRWVIQFHTADVKEINEDEIATGNVLTNDEADNTEIKSFTVDIDGDATGNVLTNDEADNTEIKSFTVDIDGDGNAESFTFGQTATIAGVGQFVLNKDGSYSFTPDANWNGVMPQVTYTTNLDATNTLDITVKAVNTDTVADVQEINEDEIATGNVLTNDEADNTEIKSFTVDIDGDGNAESFTFGQTATIAGVGQFVLNKDGSYSFTPDANWNGVMPQVTYTTNLDATNTLDITVKAVNTDTVADVQEINEDEIATGNVLTNDEADNTEIKSFTVDIDGDGNAESFTFGQTATIAGVGQFVLNKDGSYATGTVSHRMRTGMV